MVEAIERIHNALQGRKSFEENELIQTWFVQNLQIIGETARALPADI